MSRLTRRADWPRRLMVAIERQSKTPFTWGKHDCCRAACDLVEAMTGENPAAAHRLSGYKTARGAFGKLGRLVGREVAIGRRVEAAMAMIARTYGAREVPKNYAQRGDVVLARADTPAGDSDVMAVVDLSGRYAVAPMDVGWASLPREAWRRAWRVGD